MTTAGKRTSIPSTHTNAPIQNLLVLTKAYDVAPAVTAISHRLQEGGNILFLSNGRGFHEELVAMHARPGDQAKGPSFLFGSRVWYGTTSHGALIPPSSSGSMGTGPSQAVGTCMLPVDHTGFGKAFIGLPPGARPLCSVDGVDGVDGMDSMDTSSTMSCRAQPLAAPASTSHRFLQALIGCGLNVTIDDHIDKRLWMKLCANACINALTAIHQVTNGHLQHDPACLDAIREVCHEVSAVMLAEGVHVGSGLATRPSSSTEDNDNAGLLEAFVLEVIRDTAGNQSSMYRDVLQGRRTEIEYINGYILSKAQQHGLEAPTTHRLYRQIQELST